MKIYSKKDIIKATEKSLEHWEENLKLFKQGEFYFEEHGFSDSCPLCQLFIERAESSTNCIDCPLNENETGGTVCCEEWRKVRDASFSDKMSHRGLQPFHFEMLIDRIRTELEKLRKTP